MKLHIKLVTLAVASSTCPTDPPRIIMNPFSPVTGFRNVAPISPKSALKS